MIEMFVTGVALDVRSNVPLVILNDKEREFTLPIWIGQFEAQAIARALEGIETERPMSHDLLLDTIYSLDAEVDSIEINSFEDSTFYAAIIITDANEATLSIDSRPSDAIALALRCEAPIFVSKTLLQEVAKDVEVIDGTNPDKVPRPEKRVDKEFREFLKYVKASDFTLDRKERD